MNYPKAVAYHEAGHAVIARLLNVETTETFSDHASGHVQTPSLSFKEQGTPAFKEALLTDMKIALAGPIAEHRHSPQIYKKSQRDGSHKEDLENIVSFAFMYFFGDKFKGTTVSTADLPPEVINLIDEVKRSAAVMVKDNWNLIKFVGDILLAT